MLFSTSIFIINRLSSKMLKLKTLIEKQFNQKVTMLFLKPLDAYVTFSFILSTKINITLGLPLLFSWGTTLTIKGIKFCYLLEKS